MSIAVVASIVSMAQARATDICEDADVRAAMAEVTTEAESAHCQKPVIIAQFRHHADLFIESLELLLRPVPATGGDGATSTSESTDNGGEEGTGTPTAPAEAAEPELPTEQMLDDISELRERLTALEAIDLSDAAATEAVKQETAAAFAIIQRLTAPLSPMEHDQFSTSHRLDFCGVMLEWKLSGLWRDHLSGCSDE